jgi:hypothetical protein
VEEITKEKLSSEKKNKQTENSKNKFYSEKNHAIIYNVTHQNTKGRTIMWPSRSNNS